MATHFLNQEELTAADKWYVIDAADMVLGRLASKAALLLTGKGKPTYAPFSVSGDHVIIINAAKVRVTGQKLDQKVYRWHTRYPSGLKEVSARKTFENKPDWMIREAILGMLPKNKLRQRMVNRLRVYVDDRHPHQAQKPEPVKV